MGQLYKAVISPILDRLDSETMHHFAVDMIHFSESSALTRAGAQILTMGAPRVKDPRLSTTVGGIVLDNPTMVAAGWDKYGRAVRGLYDLGFGGVEIGSVLEFAQPGNPKPRQWWIGPGVVLQALGFNTPGMEAVAANLARYEGLGIPLGINIAKNKDVPEEDSARAYATVARRLYRQATYFVINVSSPNTPGLRRLQNKPLLLEIVAAVKEAILSQGPMKPTFVKIAPDLPMEGVDDVIDVVLAHELAGIVATNTSNNPDLRAKYGEKWRGVTAGISGDDPVYRQMATEKVSHIYRSTQGKLDIIGVGGVKDGATALEKIRAGAKAVQVIAAMRSEGPCVARTICRELLTFMDREGVKSLSELVGTAA